MASLVVRPEANPQPGGRAPAPGNLALVQAFVNSNYDLVHNHGAELFASPEALRDWLLGRGLVEAEAAIGENDLREAIHIRESLRALLMGQPADLRLPVTVRLSEEGPGFTPATDDARGAFGLVLAYSAAAMLDGSWRRLKACKECSWAFYDHSRNGAGNWCSMKVCGGRVKQRRYYASQS
jgi:predicted RNA-binding Zn ribbon-like protein